MNYKISILLSILLVLSGCQSALQGSAIVSPVDNYSKAIITNEFETTKVYNGQSYFYSTSFILNQNEVKNFLFNTNISDTHLRNFEVACSAAIVDINFYENTTYSNIGNEEPTLNKNRNFNDSPKSKIYTNSTILTNGTLIYEDAVIGTKQSGGSASLNLIEWILKDDQNYLLSIRNLNVNDNNCYLNVFWYEN